MPFLARDPSQRRLARRPRTHIARVRHGRLGLERLEPGSLSAKRCRSARWFCVITGRTRGRAWPAKSRGASARDRSGRGEPDKSACRSRRVNVQLRSLRGGHRDRVAVAAEGLQLRCRASRLLRTSTRRRLTTTSARPTAAARSAGSARRARGPGGDRGLLLVHDLRPGRRVPGPDTSLRRQRGLGRARHPLALAELVLEQPRHGSHDPVHPAQHRDRPAWRPRRPGHHHQHGDRREPIHRPRHAQEGAPCRTKELTASQNGHESHSPHGSTRHSPHSRRWKMGRGGPRARARPRRLRGRQRACAGRQEEDREAGQGGAGRRPRLLQLVGVPRAEAVQEVREAVRREGARVQLRLDAGHDGQAAVGQPLRPDLPGRRVGRPPAQGQPAAQDRQGAAPQRGQRLRVLRQAVVRPGRRPLGAVRDVRERPRSTARTSSS